jgi:hypothetical protein
MSETLDVLMSDLYLLQHMVLSIKTGTVPNDDKTTPPTKQKDPSSMAAYQIQAWPTHLAQSQMVASRMIKPGECVLSETALIVVSGQPGRTEPIFWSREFGAVSSGAANPGYVATIAPETDSTLLTEQPSVVLRYIHSTAISQHLSRWFSVQSQCFPRLRKGLRRCSG